MAGGRPAIFKTPTDMKLAWDEYIKHCKKEDKPITKLGFAVYKGFGRTLFCEYRARKEFTNVLEHIDSYSELHLTEKALKGEYNSNIAKLVLSAKHGVNERTEQKIEANVNVKSLREDIIDEIEKE